MMRLSEEPFKHTSNKASRQTFGLVVRGLSSYTDHRVVSMLLLSHLFNTLRTFKSSHALATEVVILGSRGEFPSLLHDCLSCKRSATMNGLDELFRDSKCSPKPSKSRVMRQECR
eukprot:1300016-Amphidinium_carterae.1